MEQSPFTALIIDDNEHNCEIFRITLERVGYEAQAFDISTDGFAVLEKQAFDLLVIDLQMPVLDGLEILRRIRHLPHLQKMKRLVVTANSHMLNDEIEEMADYIMQKPIDISDFANLAKRLVPA